jgi:hypothetical protein
VKKECDPLSDSTYCSLANVQVMACVTVKEGASPADAELTMYLEKAAAFIEDALKDVANVSLNPVPEIIHTVAEFYASGLFLAKNNLAENQTEHPNIILAEKNLAGYKTSLRRSFKLITSK